MDATAACSAFPAPAVKIVCFTWWQYGGQKRGPLCSYRIHMCRCVRIYDADNMISVCLSICTFVISVYYLHMCWHIYIYTCNYIYVCIYICILHTFTYLCACAPAFIGVYRVLVCFRVYAHHLLRPRHTPPHQLPWASVQGADGMRLIALSILSQGYGSQLLEPTKIRWCLTRNHRFTVSEDFLGFHDKHPSKWPCTQASWVMGVIAQKWS